MAPRTRGANALAAVPPPEPEPEAPATPVVALNNIQLIENDALPLYLQNWDETQRKLREPFDPDDIYFLPQTVNYDKRVATAAAYADTRVYVARMNQVIGAGFWKSEVRSMLTAPFTKHIKAKLDYRNKNEDGTPRVITPASEISAHKAGGTLRIYIYMGPRLDWVFHDSTGAKDTADENWITSAEAQGYKRAFSKWGVGEYLYHFPKQECDYDTKAGTWKQQPLIPDWAYPSHNCADCGAVIDHFYWTDKNGNSQSKHFWQIVLSTRKLYGRQLCPACAKKAQAAQTTPEAQERLQ